MGKNVKQVVALQCKVLSKDSPGSTAKNLKNLRIVWCPGQNSDRVAIECKPEALQLKLTCSVKKHV
jgi:hypothetical protein